MSTAEERVDRLAARLGELEAERRQALRDGNPRRADEHTRTSHGLIAETLTPELRLLVQRWQVDLGAAAEKETNPAAVRAQLDGVVT